MERQQDAELRATHYNMLVRFTRRFGSSLIHATAAPHNEASGKAKQVMVYDAQGTLVPRNSLVLKSEPEIEKYVLNLFKNYWRIGNPGKVTLDSRFVDHGLDSLDAVELVVRVEDELGYVIPAEALRCFCTVSSFVNYIKQTEDFKREFNKEPIN
jgi:acyl carrier protein